MDGPLIEDYSESLSVAAAIASTTPSLCAQMNPLSPSSALQTVTPSAVRSASPQTSTPGCSTPVTTKSSSLLADSDSELEQFLEKGCGCKRASGRPCYTLFSKEHYQEITWQCAELTRVELDMVLMGQIMATLSNDPETSSSKFRHTPTQRKLSSMAFFHGGHQVCGRTFRKLHGIGKHKCTLALSQTCKVLSP